jgi:tetratricopeptide (TPR) repeat protein
MRATLTLLLLCAGVPPASAQERAQQEDKVFSYLQRFGLTEYQILHLERELYERGRAGVANKLADLYTNELVRLGDAEEAKGEDLENRLRKLLAAYPKAETEAIKVMLLQREFRKAESLANKWLDDPEQQQVREAALQGLGKVAGPLDDLRKKLKEEAEQNEKLKEVALRAAYFAGWANYYHGILKDSGEGKEDLQVARASFKSFFGLEEDDRPSKDTTAESVNLENFNRARAALGVILCEAALNNAEAAGPWINLLRDPATNPQVRDSLRQLLVWALLRSAASDRAKAEAEREIADFAEGAASPGKVGMCYVLIKQGFDKDAGASGGRQPSESARRELGLLGLKGLIRMRQLDLAGRQIEKYQIAFDEKAGFLYHWVPAQRLFEKAAKTKTASDRQVALQALEKALASADAAQEPLLAAEGRRQLAWCHQQQGQLEKAVSELAQAAELLKQLRAPSAAETAWQVCHLHLALAQKDARHKDAAIRSLEALKRDFPDFPKVAEADLHLGRLKFDVQALEAIPPQAPNYADARYELCRHAYDEWVQARRDPQHGPEAALLLKKRLDTFLPLVSPPPSKGGPGGVADGKARQILNASLWGAELALVGKPADIKRAQALLQRADSLLAGLKPDDAAVQNHRYWRLRLAQAVKDEAGAREHAAWLMEHARDSVYEKPAVIVAAEQMHTRVEKSSGAERARLLEQGMRLYERLVELSGSASLKSDKNARVAASRLAHYAFELGEYEIAAQQYDRLLEAEPRDAIFLHKAGLAHFRTRNFERSLEIWRVILPSIQDKKSKEWFEAKYYLTASLARVDVDRARDALQQFRLLYPDLGPSPWREEFQKLERTLQGQEGPR